LEEVRVSRVRAIVLGALVAVVSVLGVMPAASAASLTGISWSGTDGTLSLPWARTSVCPASGSFTAGQVVQVQVLSGSTWVTQRTYVAPPPATYWCVDVSLFDLVPKPGRYSFRAVTQAAPGGPVLTTDTSATLAAATPSVRTETVEFTATTAGKWVTATVDIARGQTLELQRKAGPGHVTVSRVTAPRSGEDVSVRLPVATRVGQATYRVVSRPAAWTGVAVSSYFDIHQTDYVRYSAYIATARRYIASYCPKTPISIDTPAVARGTGGNTIGQAPTSWSTWSAPGESYLRTNIALRSGLSAESLKHTVLHECAHVVQARAVVENKKAVDEQRARQIYGAMTYEAEADCMAVLYSKASSEMYYIRSCNAAQMNEGYRIWRAYGLKYQAATYTW
jgi:hypothetical protein